jgi:hypothetical protein
VEHLLSFVPPETRDIVMELRSIIAAASSGLTETILWGALSYHDARKGGRVRGAVCGIEFRSPKVRLSFIHGVRLRDPDRLLKGDRLSKRHIVIDSYQGAPWDSIRLLVQQAAALGPADFGPLGPAAGDGKR